MKDHKAWRIAGARSCRICALAFVLGAFPGGAPAQIPTAASQEATPSTGITATPEGLIEEPRVIGRVIDFATRTIGDGTDRKNGVYLEMSNMPTGAGWISVGPGYRHWLLGDEMLVEASSAVSWRIYKMAQARFELPYLVRSRLTFGSQIRWQDLTQVSYFGEGPDSLDADRSEYRLKSTNIAGYAVVRPVRWLSIGGRLGWLNGPSLLAPAGTFKRGNPATQDVFPTDPVFALADQPAFVYGETSVTADTRDQRGHPTRGGLYRAAWVRYSDRDANAFTFDRAETEAAHFLPVLKSRLILAMHGWFVATGTSDGAHVPFYLTPALGGHNTIRGYNDYRFHDRNLLVLNVESRVALMTHVDLAVFGDAGNVAPRVSELNLDKTSYGVGFRVHSHKSTFARIDVAHGAEGWNFLFRLSDPLHLARLSRRTAPIPFVP